MSKYTTELRFYCESLAGYSTSQDYGKIDSVVQTAAPQIFEKFPIWDESYRLALEVKILKHYYVRELCAETPGLWKLWLNNRMNEIMPYYNQLYKSAELDFNPFHDVDITKDHVGDDTQERNITQKQTDSSTSEQNYEGTQNSESSIFKDDKTDGTQSSNVTKSSLDKYSDTPQGGIDGPIFTNYLTNARDIAESGTEDKDTHSETSSTQSDEIKTNSNDKTTSDQSSESSSDANETVNSTDKYLEHISGKQGTQSYSSMLMEYRETLMNIDKMIIEDLADLFFTLY